MNKNKLKSRRRSAKNEKYFALMTYEPGDAETGIEGDIFSTIDVIAANNEDEATREFKKKHGNKINIGGGSDFVNEIDKDRYEEVLADIEWYDQYIAAMQDMERSFDERTESKKITENIDTWQSDIKKIAIEIANLELPTDEGVEQLVYRHLALIRTALDRQLSDYMKFTGGWKKGNRKKSESKKLVKESKLREFTDFDWNGFAGAERFEDGSEPLIAEFIDGIATVLVSGVSDEDYTAQVQLLYLDEDEDEASEGGWYKDFETKQDAVRFAKQLGGQLDYFTPEDTTYDDMENIAYSEKMGMLY